MGGGLQRGCTAPSAPLHDRGRDGQTSATRTPGPHAAHAHGSRHRTGATSASGESVLGSCSRVQPLQRGAAWAAPGACGAATLRPDLPAVATLHPVVLHQKTEGQCVSACCASQRQQSWGLCWHGRGLLHVAHPPPFRQHACRPLDDAAIRVLQNCRGPASRRCAHSLRTHPQDGGAVPGLGAVPRRHCSRHTLAAWRWIEAQISRVSNGWPSAQCGLSMLSSTARCAHTPTAQHGPGSSVDETSRHGSGKRFMTY